MYYGLVCIAVVLFGTQFLTKSEYVKKMGSGLFQTMFLSLLGGVLGAVIMLFTNKFRFEYTHFTLIMAFVSFLNGFLFTLCSLKSFERVNLAVYSIYSMLGGMILPILAGVIFYEEAFTLGLGLCIAFIGVAIVLVSVKKSEKSVGEKSEKSWISLLFYIGVFLFNGMAGVISKFYTEAPYLKATSAGYSLLSSLVTVAVSLIFVLLLWKKRPKIYTKPTLIAFCGNAGNRVANYLLLLALAVLPASVNYSFVTGGTIIVSTALSYFTDKKPTTKEWIAVVAAFIGIMCLVLLPF